MHVYIQRENERDQIAEREERKSLSRRCQSFVETSCTRCDVLRWSTKRITTIIRKFLRLELMFYLRSMIDGVGRTHSHPLTNNKAFLRRAANDCFVSRNPMSCQTDN